MKNKGFTIVEMLGVMTLLAIIFAFLYPNIMHMLEGGKGTDYENYKNNVFLATEAYVNSDSTISASLINEGDTTTVTYQDLLQSGFLSTKVVNPKTGDSVASEASNGTKVIITVLSDKTFDYTIE